jgi:hypothetical protein
MLVCRFQEDILDSMKNSDSQPDFAENTYKSTKIRVGEV